MVGSALIRHLLAAGYGNVVSSRHSRAADKKSPLGLNLDLDRFFSLDLRRQGETESFFARERPEYVFLAAAKVGGIHANNTYRAEFIYDNLMIEANVIHAAHAYGVKKLLLLGSSCIYPKFAPQPLQEAHLLTGLLEPTNEPYAIAKIAGIKLCESFNRQYGTDFISCMPTNLYGPGDNFDPLNSHVIPGLIRRFHEASLLAEQNEVKARVEGKVMNGTPAVSSTSTSSYALQPQPSSVVIWGTGTPKREFLHVDDLADACVFLMQNYSGNETVNVGSGAEVTIRELAEMIREITGFTGEIVFDPTKPDGTPRKLLDSTKINAMGWHAKTPLAEGLKKTYEWYIKKKDVKREA